MIYFKRFLNFVYCFLFVNCAVWLYVSAVPTTSAVTAMILSAILFIAFNISPSQKKLETFRLRVLNGGCELLIVFAAVLFAEAIFFLLMLFNKTLTVKQLIISMVLAVVFLSIVFFNGIIRVYLTSVQLGLRLRVLGVIFGMIFPINLCFLFVILKTCIRECSNEQEMIVRDKARNDEKLCATKYPILMVHGVFFRDLSFFNYWGRVPSALERNGAKVFYADQESAASCDKCAEQIISKIRAVVAQTGCEKVNIIAHSKGGLDSRRAITMLGNESLVASLTTVNTPHRGCLFAEYLLDKAPQKVRNQVAGKYNAALLRLGDKSPDFIAAVSNLTSSFVSEFNGQNPNSSEVYYQSVGSVLGKASSGRFPLNFSYHLVKLFDGGNDGLVSLESMKWGESFIELTPKYKRGISHGDMIDLNREDIKGFDIREFYISIVSELKNKGF